MDVMNDAVYFIAIILLFGAFIFGMFCFVNADNAVTDKTRRYECVLVFPADFDRSHKLNQLSNDKISEYTVDKKFNVEFPHKPSRGEVFKIGEKTYMIWDIVYRYRDIEGIPVKVEYPVMFRHDEKPVTVATKVK